MSSRGESGSTVAFGSELDTGESEPFSVTSSRAGFWRVVGYRDDRVPCEYARRCGVLDAYFTLRPSPSVGHSGAHHSCPGDSLIIT